MRRDSALLSHLWLIGMLSVLLLAASCATKKDIREFRQEMQIRNDNAESRLFAIEQSLAQIDSLVREQQRLSQSLRAVFGTQNQDQRDNLDLIAARQDEINYQLRELLQKLQVIQLYGGVGSSPAQAQPSQTDGKSATTQDASPSTSAPAQSGAGKVDASQVYNTALDDVRNERFELAESRFLSFLMQFPDHELAGNAQYWLGEAVYGQGKFELAITEFDKVLSKYKKSPKIPAAMLKIGFANIELGNRKQGTAMLNKLIKAYPKSDETKLARERLSDLQ